MAKIETGDYAIVLRDAAIEYINGSTDKPKTGNTVKVITRERTTNSIFRKKYHVTDTVTKEEFYIYSPYLAKISSEATPILNEKYNETNS